MSERILIMKGSPVENGRSQKQINQILEYIDDMGIHNKVINVYEKSIEYCNGCQNCFKTGECLIEDDVWEIIEEIKKSTILVYVFPIYNLNVPAKLKTLMERLTYLTYVYYLSGKKVLYISSSNGSDYSQVHRMLCNEAMNALAMPFSNMNKNKIEALIETISTEYCLTPYQYNLIEKSKNSFKNSDYLFIKRELFDTDK